MKSLPEDVPELAAEDGWTPLEMPLNTKRGRSFIDHDPSGNGIALRMFVRESDHRLFARVWFGPEVTGPPGHAHGGSIAAVLDHCMGLSCWVAGHPVVAATITVNFRASVPLRDVYTIECWVDNVDGKKITSRGRISGADGKEYSTSDGLFIEQPMERFKKFVQPPGS